MKVENMSESTRNFKIGITKGNVWCEILIKQTLASTYYKEIESPRNLIYKDSN